MRSYWCKSMVLVDLGSDFEKLTIPIGLITFNSLGALCEVGLPCYLVSLGFIIGFGPFIG